MSTFINSSWGQVLSPDAATTPGLIGNQHGNQGGGNRVVGFSPYAKHATPQFDW
jgi:hypothetical protein